MTGTKPLGFRILGVGRTLSYRGRQSDQSIVSARKCSKGIVCKLEMMRFDEDVAKNLSDNRRAGHGRLGLPDDRLENGTVFEPAEFTFGAPKLSKGSGGFSVFGRRTEIG